MRAFLLTEQLYISTEIMKFYYYKNHQEIKGRYYNVWSKFFLQVIATQSVEVMMYLPLYCLDTQFMMFKYREWIYGSCRLSFGTGFLKKKNWREKLD
uniref:Ovule protein n=1 Tax=Meloidogyne hapla TaxID=6305 RepID=A0A1I8BNB0_MELHA